MPSTPLPPLHPLSDLSNPHSPTALYHALQTRTRTHPFIYSVLTTGIYCRPTCPSRLARRANVIFHTTPAEAAAAGFRPCKRCRPDVEGWEAGGEVRGKVERAKGLIRAGAGKEKRVLGLGELSRAVGMSKSHFLRVFKAWAGCTPREWGARLGKGGEEEEVDEAMRVGQMAEGGGAWVDRACDEVVDLNGDFLSVGMGEVDPWSWDGLGNADIATPISAATTEPWDLYFYDLSLPLETTLPPEIELPLPLEAATPEELELLTPTASTAVAEPELKNADSPTDDTLVTFGFAMEVTKSDEWPFDV